MLSNNISERGFCLVDDNLVDDVIQTISDWTPKAEYSSERKYRDDLLECLRQNLNAEFQEYSSAIWGLEHSGCHCIQKEAGRSLADIGIDNEIGIELKRNFKSKTQMNRLVGQVIDHLFGGYFCVIIVLCGRTDQEAFDTLKHNLQKIFSSFSAPCGDEEKLVKIVSKSKYKRPKKHKLSSVYIST